MAHIGINVSDITWSISLYVVISLSGSILHKIEIIFSRHPKIFQSQQFHHNLEEYHYQLIEHIPVNVFYRGLQHPPYHKDRLCSVSRKPSDTGNSSCSVISAISQQYTVVASDKVRADNIMPLTFNNSKFSVMIFSRASICNLVLLIFSLSRITIAMFVVLIRICIHCLSILLITTAESILI